jgi:hypothetical protein
MFRCFKFIYFEAENYVVWPFFSTGLIDTAITSEIKALPKNFKKWMKKLTEKYGVFFVKTSRQYSRRRVTRPYRLGRQLEG